MPLNRTYADVLLENPDDAENPLQFHIEIRSADMLHAEQAAQMRGIDLTSQVHVGHLWAWSALRRTQQLPEGCEEFEKFVKAAIAVGMDQKKVDTVPPTRPEVSGDSVSDSPSEPSSPTSGG